MKPISSRLFVISTAVGLSLICQSAFAASVSVDQDYIILGNPSNRDDLRNTLITATIGFNDSSLTGIGTEFIPLESVGLLFSDRGLSTLPMGLNFSSTVDPAAVGNFNALYIDGVYQKFGRTDTGDLFRASFSPTSTTSAGSIDLISFTFAGTFGEGQLSFAPISNPPRYNTSGTGAPRITLETVSPVPLPAALPLFLAALSGLGFFGWRRKRQAVAA